MAFSFLSDRLVQNIPTQEDQKMLREDQEELQMLEQDNTGGMMRETLSRFMESGDPQIRDIISSLMAAGTPMRRILEQVQQYIQNPESIMSLDEGRFEGSPHSEGPYFRKFNKGGIVSLKHLTRPLKV